MSHPKNKHISARFRNLSIKRTMVNVVFSGESESDIKLLIQFAQKIGIKTKVLNSEELEDLGLGLAIEKGKSGELIDTQAFLKKMKK